MREPVLQFQESGQGCGAMSAVERALDLLASMRAKDAACPPLDVAALAEMAEDHGLDQGQLFDALCFLEANALIEVRTVIIIAGARS